MHAEESANTAVLADAGHAPAQSVPVLYTVKLYEEIAKPLWKGKGDIPEGYNRLGVTQADIDAFVKDARSYDIKWLRWYEELMRFFKHQGHCNVPQKYITVCGQQLGVWVSCQRSAENNPNSTKVMTDERRALLNKLGFVWDNPEAAWQ